jgi:hypothetical protein
MAKTPPAAKFRIGLVTATVWKNDAFYSVNLSRSYKDDDGNWQETDGLGQSDLLNAVKVLERAEAYIAGQ